MDSQYGKSKRRFFVQLLSHVQLLGPHESHHARLPCPSQSASASSVMPSNHFFICHPLLLPSIFSSIRVFSSESALWIRWPKYWNFSFNISPSSEHPGLNSLGWTGWISVQSKDTQERVFSNTKVQTHRFFSVWFSLWSKPHIHT